MTSPSTVEALIILLCIALINVSDGLKLLSCSDTYVTGSLIEYTVQKITKALIALAHAA